MITYHHIKYVFPHSFLYYYTARLIRYRLGIDIIDTKPICHEQKICQTLTQLWPPCRDGNWRGITNALLWYCIEIKRFSQQRRNKNNTLHHRVRGSIVYNTEKQKFPFWISLILWISLKFNRYFSSISSWFKSRFKYNVRSGYP